MKVRRAIEGDGAAVVALWTAAYTDDPRGGRATSYSIGDFQLAVTAGEVLVAEADGGIVGVVVLYEGGVRDGQVADIGEFELSRLAVAEEFRREGLGRLLAEACLRLAGEKGGSSIVLWSRPHQVEAQLSESGGCPSHKGSRSHDGAHKFIQLRDGLWGRGTHRSSNS